MKIKIGDWVNSYSKGIYRVEKIVEQFYDESDAPAIIGKNKIGDTKKDRVVISKRFLNSKFQKSIGYETCSEYYVSHLSNKQSVKLKEVLAHKPALLLELDTYTIPTLISIYNLPLQIDHKKDLETVLTLISFIKEGKTFLDTINEMKRLNIMKLIPKFFGNYTLQLFNYDEEYVQKRKMWRDAKLIESI